MPTKDSLSAPGSFRSGRALVSAGQVDASAIGQGMKSAARGIGQIGEALYAREEKEQRENDALDLIRAEAAKDSALFETERAFDQDGDYSSQDQRFTPQAVDATNRAAALIRDPQKREMWRLKSENDINARRERLIKRADVMGKQERLVQLENTLEGYRNAFTDPQASGEDRERILQQSRTAIELSKRAGIVDPVHASKYEDTYVRGAIKQDAERRLNDDPEGLRRDLLGERAPQGELEIGNIDLSKRGAVKNADGSISTLKSISINENGREVLIPTIDPEGREMTEEESIERYLGTGEHLGRFDTPDNATGYAKRLSERMGKKFLPHRGATPESISVRLETGKTDPLEGVKNISRDSADSRSYGNFGLNSRAGAGAHQFAAEYGPALGLSGTPGTPEFDRSWKAVANADPKGLHAAEMDWYSKNVLLPTQGELSAAGLPGVLAEDARVVAYFADRKIQQGPASIGNHAERVRAAFEKSGGKVEPFLRAMTEADRANLDNDFPTALRTGAYSERGNNNRVYNRMNMALALGAESSEPQLHGRYAALSPLERSDYIAKAERAARTRFEGQRENLKQALDDDVESIRRTGQSGDPDIDLARRVLEPNQVNRYFLNRAEAEMEHRATHDLHTLREEDLQKRLSDDEAAGGVGPKPGEPFFEAKAKVYDKVEKKISDIRTLRETDPARAVDEFPEVKTAAEAAQAAPDDPEALQNLARARLDAQGKVGIPDGLRTPITKAEAKVLAAPLRGVEGEHMEKAATDWFTGLQQRYGPYGRSVAEASIEYALTRDKDLAKVVTGQIESITQGIQPTAASIRRTEYLMEANRALGAYGGDFVGEPMRQYGANPNTTSKMLPDGVTPMELYRAPEGIWINDRFIPEGAAKLLEDNPALASQFNAHYGAGLAETVLANRKDEK
jgi:hypothetical protein